MRELSLVCITGLVLCLMGVPVWAVQFHMDFLEPGNEGGFGGLKTFDEEWVVGKGESVAVDVWIGQLEEPLLTAGLWVFFDPSILTIEEVAAFDNIDLPGPWDHLMTRKAHYQGSGDIFACGNLSGVSPDGCGDVLIVRITFHCNAPGSTLITFTTIPGFDSVVGFSGKLYDHDINAQFSVIPLIRMVRDFLFLGQFEHSDSAQFPYCSIKVD